jgi:hypothetical protein
LIGLYLATNRHANMLGLYRLRIDDVRHETGLGTKAIAKGLQAAQETGYAAFDAVTEFAWVRQMARFRLGLKAGEGLREGDKRAGAISRIYHAIESNPFLGEFHDVNKKMLPLGRRRNRSALWCRSVRTTRYSPIEAPSKGVRQIQSQIQETGIRNRSSNRNPLTPFLRKGASAGICAPTSKKRSAFGSSVSVGARMSPGATTTSGAKS